MSADKEQLFTFAKNCDYYNDLSNYRIAHKVQKHSFTDNTATQIRNMHVNALVINASTNTKIKPGLQLPLFIFVFRKDFRIWRTKVELISSNHEDVRPVDIAATNAFLDHLLQCPSSPLIRINTQA